MCVLEDDIDFVGGGAEAAEGFGFHFDWCDDILSESFIDFFLDIFFFLFELILIAEGVFF